MKFIFDPLWFISRSVTSEPFTPEDSNRLCTRDGVRRCSRFRLAHLVVLSTALSLSLGCDEQSPTDTSHSEVGHTSEPTARLDNSPADSEGAVASPTSEHSPTPSPTSNTSPTLRRMPASTYENALRALFDDEILSAQQVETVYLPVALELNNFDNNAAVDVASPALVEAYHNRALAISEQLLGLTHELFDCVDLDEDEHLECMTEGFAMFARRAWRRSLTDDEWTNLSTLRSDLLDDLPEEEVDALMLQYILQSPHFLYYPEFGTPDESAGPGMRRLTPFELAARMAAFLWDSIPDEDLLYAAEVGELETTEHIRAQARRMLDDGRAKSAVQNFYRQLLEFNAIGANNVNFSIQLPSDTDQVDVVENDTDYLRMVLIPAMRAEAISMVDREIVHHDGTLEGLLSANRGYVTYDTANIYGAGIPEDAPTISMEETGIDAETVVGEIGQLFEVDLDAAQRAGFLTTIGFLSSHSKPLYPSPVERGVYILDRILCNKPAPPPDQVPELDETTANMVIRTNRDRYAQHTSDPACAGCHTLIDGIGFTFENYDTLGDWRDTDNGYPVDASGELLGTDVDGPVTDAVELIHTLAGSRRVHDCHVSNWSRYALARSTSRADASHLQTLQNAFWDSQGDIQSLLVNLVLSPIFRTVREISQ